MADKSEVFCWLKSFSPGMKLERLSLQFETKGFRWQRSLASVKMEDLDSFFPFPDKLLIGTFSTESFHATATSVDEGDRGEDGVFPAKNVWGVLSKPRWRRQRGHEKKKI